MSCKVGARRAWDEWAVWVGELRSAAGVVCGYYIPALSHHVRVPPLTPTVPHKHTQREGGDPAFRPFWASRFWGNKKGARSHVLLGRSLFSHTA